jgi:hypothetical protein
MRRNCLASIVADDERAIWSVQQTRGITGNIDHSILPDGLVVVINDKHAIVELVGYDGVAVRESNRITWQRIGVAAWIRVGEILGDYPSGSIHLQDPCVSRIGDQGIPVRQSAGECRQINAIVVLPENPPAAIDLDDPVVALICNKDMAVLK